MRDPRYVVDMHSYTRPEDSYDKRPVQALAAAALVQGGQGRESEGVTGSAFAVLISVALALLLLGSMILIAIGG